MTREETIKVIGIITTAYPNFDKFRDEKHIRSMVAIWADMFSEDDAGLVALAVKEHISTSKWPPSIAEIREIMTRIAHPDIIPPDEAWEVVSKYLDTEGEYNHGDIYRALPRTIAEAVDSIGYGQLYAMHVAYARGHAAKAGLDRVAFMQAYEDTMNNNITGTIVQLNEYPPDKFNVLIPVTTMQVMSNLQRIIVNKVQLDVADPENSKDIYREKSSGKYAITKVGGMKLAAAANISIVETESGMTDGCKRCVDMARAVGKRKPCHCWRHRAFTYYISILIDHRISVRIIYDFTFTFCKVCIYLLLHFFRRFVFWRRSSICQIHILLFIFFI